jgi:hypothetical protein
MKTGFIKKNINFEKSQEIKERSAEFKKTIAALSSGLYLISQTFSRDCPFKVNKLIP